VPTLTGQQAELGKQARRHEWSFPCGLFIFYHF